MSLNDAVKIMRVSPAVKILLTIVREGEEAPLKLPITRDIIKVKRREKRGWLEKGLWLLRISVFNREQGTV